MKKTLLTTTLLAAMAGMALAAVNPTVELVWSDMEKDYDSDPLLELAGIRLEI